MGSYSAFVEDGSPSRILLIRDRQLVVHVYQRDPLPKNEIEECAWIATILKRLKKSCRLDGGIFYGANMMPGHDVRLRLCILDAVPGSRPSPIFFTRAIIEDDPFALLIHNVIEFPRTLAAL